MEFTEEQQSYINQLINDEKNKWIKEELEPIQLQITELEKHKPKEKSDAEIALEQKELELWNKEKNLILKENNLHEFVDFFNVNDSKQLDEQINLLNKILDTRKLNNNYIPNNNVNKTDSYSQAKKNNDTLGMVKALFSK
ncbi:MAG TPA: hypothetical protein VFC73_07425 [Syntrophomonadaceae bacterium]|nr:hypothetical protein [Syntrophomonadaceae bacterium]